MALVVLSLYFGTQSTLRSQYSSEIGVFGEYMNGAIRLLFPVIVTVLAAVPLQDQLRDNFIAFTRTRQSFGRYLFRVTGAGIVRNSIYFGLLGVLTTVAVAFVVPFLNPRAVDRAGYGLSEQQLYGQNPLGGLLTFGPVAFGLGATAWMVASAATFSLLAIASVLLIRSRAIALITPAALYILESILFQVLSLPGLSLILAAPTPSSLQRYPLVVAVSPLAAVAIVAMALIAVAVWRSRRSGAYA